MAAGDVVVVVGHRNATLVRPLHPDGHLALVDLLMKLLAGDWCGEDHTNEVRTALQEAEASLDRVADEVRAKPLHDASGRGNEEGLGGGGYDTEGVATAYHRLASAVSSQARRISKTYNICHLWLAITVY
jgi:hypothetical protein